MHVYNLLILCFLLMLFTYKDSILVSNTKKKFSCSNSKFLTVTYMSVMNIVGHVVPIIENNY